MNRLYIYCILSLLSMCFCWARKNSPMLIPQAVRVKTDGKGTLPLKSLTSISFPEIWKDAGKVLTFELNQQTGLTLNSTEEASTISIERVDTLLPEAYVLQITYQGIVLKASSVSGLNHAIATLNQLILMADDGRIPYIDIYDKPFYGYRGLMIDCSRHFFTIEQLKKCVRQMALFKLNTLHLHLTDNQGWRLYCHKYPELTTKGTYYHVVKELSGQSYSYADMKELVAYAGLHGIDIIPEIDLPGHCQALLSALPQLSCNGGEFEVYPEEDSVSVRKRRGENMLCIGNSDTYRFIDSLTDELVDLFPSDYIHFGGDEVSTHIWEKCPRCQALYKKEGMASWHELQDYFTRRVSSIVRSKGKKMIGWDEINNRDAADTADVVMVWQKDGRQQLQKASERNLQVIMSPKDPCYFDFGYSRNSTRRVYEWNLTTENKTRIKGGQANLWTEFITTGKDLEKMLFPRLCALAETLWCAPENKNWSSFRCRIENCYGILDRLNTCYFRDDLGSWGFVPQTEERPHMVLPAHIETNISGIKYYYPEYAFDGDIHTFFATPYSLDKGSWFTIVLDEFKSVTSIQVIFDASKEHPDSVSLSVSTDGRCFSAVPSEYVGGVLQASLPDGTQIKAVKIELTAALMARLSIKEFVIN